MLSGKPYRSLLVPYTAEIADWRATTPPTTYQRIAQLLAERHGVKVSCNAVWNFVRVRSRGRKVYAIQLPGTVRPERRKAATPHIATAPAAHVAGVSSTGGAPVIGSHGKTIPNAQYAPAKPDDL